MIVGESTATVSGSISRLQRFHNLWTLTWGVAPGYYIPRLWR